MQNASTLPKPPSKVAQQGLEQPNPAFHKPFLPKEVRTHLK